MYTEHYLTGIRDTYDRFLSDNGSFEELFEDLNCIESFAKKDIDLSPEEYTLICNIQKFVKLCKCKYIDKDTIVAECDKNGVKL